MKEAPKTTSDQSPNQNPFHYQEILTSIRQIRPAPDQRLLVVSDVHGHLQWLKELLKKMDYGGNDVLIIVGDLVDKGSESLGTVRYVMELCRQRPVYVTMGNVDLARMELLVDDGPEGDEEFAGFLNWCRNFWKEGILLEMLSELGIPAESVTAENAGECRRQVRERFREEITFLFRCPTILTAGNYLFVHGGVPTDCLEELAGTPAKPWLKNDAFWKQGVAFERYTVVTGHWPVCLYRDVEDFSPLFDRERRIICMDGGCGVKRAGQLNGLILPKGDAAMEEITWMSHDDFPVVTAGEARPGKAAGLHVNYFDSAVELLAERGDIGEFRHLSTGIVFRGPMRWVFRDKDRLSFNDYCDRRLPVAEGEQLSLLFEAGSERYVKNSRGWAGLYDGPVSRIPAASGGGRA